MLFSTATQYCVLVLLLIAGWFFGLASAGGGRRWQERYAAERDAHTATRRDLDARRAEADKRVADAERGRDDRLTAANTRISDLETENNRLRAAAPVTAATVAPAPVRAPAAAISQPVPRTAASPAYPDDTRRGWFDWRR